MESKLEKERKTNKPNIHISIKVQYAHVARKPIFRPNSKRALTERQRLPLFVCRNYFGSSAHQKRIDEVFADTHVELKLSKTSVPFFSSFPILVGYSGTKIYRHSEWLLKKLL